MLEAEILTTAQKDAESTGQKLNTDASRIEPPLVPHRSIATFPVPAATGQPPLTSKREAFLLRIAFMEREVLAMRCCLLTTSVLLKPSLVNAYKLSSGQDDSSAGVEGTDGPAAEEGDGDTEPAPAEPTATTSDTCIPQPPSNSKGRCTLCEDDDTVSTADKAKLRPRSAHAIHVKRHKDTIADSTFHNTRRCLLRCIASMGVDPKSGSVKRYVHDRCGWMKQCLVRSPRKLRMCRKPFPRVVPLRSATCTCE